MFLQWLLWWCTVGTAISTTEFDRWRRNGEITPWYLSSISDSDAFRNHDSSNWKPYQITDNKVSHRQAATDIGNVSFHLLENEELLRNIRNALHKMTSQMNINDLRSIWNNIQNDKYINIHAKMIRYGKNNTFAS